MERLVVFNHGGKQMSQVAIKERGWLYHNETDSSREEMGYRIKTHINRMTDEELVDTLADMLNTSNRFQRTLALTKEQWRDLESIHSNILNLMGDYMNVKQQPSFQEDPQSQRSTNL
jgi:hypothetical protein